MSNTVAINIRTEAQLKNRAQQIAADLRFSLSGLINAYLKQLIRTKTVFFSSVSEEPTEFMLQALKESEADRKAGRTSPKFDNAEDAIAWLDNPRRKYAYQS